MERVRLTVREVGQPLRIWLQCSISGRLYRRRLDHEHDCLLGSPRPVHHAFGDCYSLVWIEFDDLVVEVDEEPPFKNEEKFVVVIMFMPVILPFDDPESYNALVHIRERLIKPFVFAFPHHLWNVDVVEMVEFDVEMGFVVVLLCHIYPL